MKPYQARIDKVRIGQTLADVQRIMGKLPERRNTHVRFDGISIEEWSYVTDYVRKMDATITFAGGKVAETITAKLRRPPASAAASAGG